MAKLIIKNVNKSFKDKKVLKDLSLELEGNGAYALVGPNGSGKTTLFNVITNLINRDSGSIYVNDIDNKDPKIFNYLTLLKDNTVLYDYLTGYDHLNFISYLHKLDKKRVDEIVNLLGISSYMNKKVSSYSLGMKQHLLIAMSILPDPEIIIMDEPINGLDPTAIIKFRNLINKLKEEKLIIISSHTLSEIDYITDNILFLKDGRILEEDLSRYKLEEYRYEIVDEDINRLKDIVKKSDKDLELKDNILIYKTDEEIWNFDKFLIDNEIRYKNVNKKNVGAEERYRNLFEN